MHKAEIGQATSAYMIRMMVRLLTLQIFEEPSFDMCMLTTIYVCPLEYPPAYDDLHFKIKPRQEKARKQGATT